MRAWCQAILGRTPPTEDKFTEPHASYLKDKDIDTNTIADAEMRTEYVVLLLRDGRRLVLRADPVARELYWRIKLRNRRSAFGL
jgi:hypothetical protein